jgi:hypothetical protein
MAKNFRFWITLCMLVLIIGIFGFGVWATVTDNKGIANRTTFVSGNENVFVEIKGNYEGPIIDDSQSEFLYTLNKDNAQSFDDEQVEITSWNLGTVYLSYSQTEMKLTFSFQNLNDKYALKVTPSGFACDESGVVKTYVQSAKSSTELETAENYLITSVEDSPLKDMTIAVNETGYIRYTYKVEKFSKSLEIDNNLKFLFEIVV